MWASKVEVDRAGTKVRVYHHWQRPGRAGAVTEAHTHPYADRERCAACREPERKGPVTR